MECWICEIVCKQVNDSSRVHHSSVGTAYNEMLKHMRQPLMCDPRELYLAAPWPTIHRISQRFDHKCYSTRTCIPHKVYPSKSRILQCITVHLAYTEKLSYDCEICEICEMLLQEKPEMGNGIGKTCAPVPTQL